MDSPASYKLLGLCFIAAVPLIGLLCLNSSSEEREPHSCSRCISSRSTLVCLAEKQIPRSMWRWWLWEWRSAETRPVRGPAITASLTTGFCGQNHISISRLPVENAGSYSVCSLNVLFGVVHEPQTPIRLVENRLEASSREWTKLSPSALGRLGSSSPKISISRGSLITLFIISNARPTFQYADASGYRSNFASYIGQWYINWSRGGEATVTLHSHDSHVAASDVYPPTLDVHVDRCVNMMAGVVAKSSNPQDFNVAFPGRMAPGAYTLQFQARGYAGSHGSRHIYNMNGGAVYEIDYLLMKPLPKTASHYTKSKETIVLTLPSSDKGKEVIVHVGVKEQDMIRNALNYLPWSSLSWSLHRGLRDLLLAFAKATLDEYRQALADRLIAALEDNIEILESKGWNKLFVQQHMAAMARSCVLAGGGNSGDLVRIVTCLAELCWTGPSEGLQETKFWTTRNFELFETGKSCNPLRMAQDLDGDAVIALTKCVVLEWSIDFDYQLYHQLPPVLIFE